MLQALQTLIERSSESRFWLFMLNAALKRGIPFNSPHGFRVESLAHGSAEVSIPYKRKNTNHIRGIHACALATASEFASGLALLQMLPASEYRLIMKALHVDYHYQAKLPVIARCVLEQQYIQEQVVDPLEHADSCLIKVVTECHDSQKNHICTATMEWQLKKWSAVRLKVS